MYKFNFMCTFSLFVSFIWDLFFVDVRIFSFYFYCCVDNKCYLPFYFVLIFFILILIHESGEWRRLHNEELHSLYRSPNTVRVIKSRRLRWAGHVARMEEGRSAFRILTDKPTGKSPLGDLGVDGRTILEWTLKR